MPDELVPIRPDWDAALVYDDANDAVTAGGHVFVGRRDLLDVLLGAMRQPDRRGTFLVSGYRGAGKSTLLIESIRAARRDIGKPWRLLPIVLNASEVSASLTASDGKKLEIGAVQLLAALIRTLRNLAANPDLKLPPPLIDAIRNTYTKA